MVLLLKPFLYVRPEFLQHVRQGVGAKLDRKLFDVIRSVTGVGIPCIRDRYGAGISEQFQKRVVA